MTAAHSYTSASVGTNKPSGCIALWKNRDATCYLLKINLRFCLYYPRALRALCSAHVIGESVKNALEVTCFTMQFFRFVYRFLHFSAFLLFPALRNGRPKSCERKVAWFAVHSMTGSCVNIEMSKTIPGIMHGKAMAMTTLKTQREDADVHPHHTSKGM